MRIISEFKDYYDSALGYGFDPELIYPRKQEMFEFPARRMEQKRWMPRHLDNALRIPLQFLEELPRTAGERVKMRRRLLAMPITVKIIGFCGFLFASLEIAGTTYHTVEDAVEQVPDEYLLRFGSNRQEMKALALRNSSETIAYLLKPLTVRNWSRCVAEFAGERFDAAFVESGVPIFKLEYIAFNNFNSVDTPDLIRCTLNPSLRQESFQKIKGPAEAFQDIAMYLVNQLVQRTDPVDPIPDDVLRDEKGFDKWTFRRHKDENRKH